MGQIKVALIGFGNMGKNHARVISGMEEATLISIYDPNVTLDNYPYQDIGVPSLDDLMEMQPDYCVVAVPTSLHSEVCLKLLAKKIPFLVEKPLASTLKEAEMVRRASEKIDLITAVGHIERYNPAVLEARIRLDEGVIGNLLQISTRRQGPFPHRITDVGVAMDLLTHDIDLVSYLSRSTYSTVSSFMNSLRKEKHEDYLVAIARMASGLIVNHVVNWLSPTKERIISIMGEEGTLVVDTLRSSLTLYRNGTSNISHQALQHFIGVSQGQMVGYEFERTEPLVLEHKHFIRALGGDEHNLVSLKSGYEIIRIATAIVDSNNSRTVVNL